MKNRCLKKIIAPIIPYITIGPGLWVFHNAWIAIFSYHLGMIIVVLLSHERLSLRKVFRSNNYKIPLFSILVGASAGILLYLLWPLLSIPADIDTYLQNIGLGQATWPGFLAYFILVNPWIEEYYWRGYLGSESQSVVLNDLFFSGYHIVVLAGKLEIPWLIAVFAVLSFGAWFWRQSNRISQGLLPSLASHMAADITVIFTIYWLTMR